MKINLPKLNIFKDGQDKPLNKLRIIAFFVAPFLLTLILYAMTLIFGANATLFFSQAWYAKIIFTYIFLLLLQCTIFAFCYRGLVAFIITSVLAYCFEFVNQTMCLITGDPLLPTDLFLAGNMTEITGFIEVPFTLSEFVGLVLIGIVIALYAIIAKKTDRKIVRLPFKAILSVILVILFVTTTYLYSVDVNFRSKVLKRYDVTRRAFNPIEDYQASGSILTFLPRIGDMLVEEPDNYSKENVMAAMEGYKEEINYPLEVKPNVIAIQNEAWWDPTNIKKAEFNIDPMELFEQYGLDSVHAKTGMIRTPVFAGGTCMPEFEFLTGLSVINLPPNTYPYIQSIKGDTASFVWEYRNNNYETVAIHPYQKNFYERDTAYKFLGFETFLGEEDMLYTDKKGLFISDESSFKEIIRVYEEKKKERAYIFCVTMQNHGGYTKERYDKYDVEIKSDALTKEDLVCLTDFSQGVYDTMQAFKMLTDYFEGVDEPTLIVMYGDHLPLLGNSGETYINGGMIPDQYLEQYGASPNLYGTPYIIWANYDISSVTTPKYASPAVFGMEVYKMSVLDNVPKYYKMISTLFDDIPVYHNHGLIFKDGTIFGDEHEEKYVPIISDYKLLQYDLLHGKKYAFRQ